MPPSYDRKPIKIEIDIVDNKPRVILTFKSTTSESVRIFSIYRFSVASSAKSEHSITILEVNHKMSEIWCRFAKNVMYKWDRGYRFKLLDQERKGEIGKNLMEDEIRYEESVKEIAETHKMAEEYYNI